MRLWHYELIPLLPRQQLLAQWRECCCIARNIAVNGTPNHLLVNKILNYPYYDFLEYSNMIILEFENRGYKINTKALTDFKANVLNSSDKFNNKKKSHSLFIGWHNDRYLKQCFYNLQEKFDCGGISEEEWDKVCDQIYMKKFLGKISF